MSVNASFDEDYSICQASGWQDEVRLRRGGGDFVSRRSLPHMVLTPCQILKPACEFYKRMAHIEGKKIISKCYFYGWWSSFVKMHFINLKKAFTEKKLLNSSGVKSLIVNIP